MEGRDGAASGERLGAAVATPATGETRQAQGVARDAVGCESAELRARRLEALATLVPPLVHKLGNALGAVMGLVDLAHRRGPGANPSWLRDAGDQARVSHDLVQLVSRLARPPAGRADPEDLGALAKRAGELLEPLAQSRGARLLPPRLCGAAVLRVDGTAVLHWLAIAGAEALAAPARGADGREAPRPVAVRLGVRAVGGGAELTVCVAWRERADPPGALPCTPVEPGEGFTARARTSRRARSTRSVLVLESRAPARGSPLPRPAPALPARAPGAPARVVLLEPDAALADLIEMVLAEAGYEVERAADGAVALHRARGGEHDLVLVGPHGVREHELAALARLSSDGSGCPVALLGAVPHGPAAALPGLMKPFRPAELLAYVAARLAART